MTNKAILVVDDDDDVRGAMKEALELDGHKVLVAYNGIDALKVLREDTSHDVGLIILDIMMPQMTGVQFLQELKNHYPQFLSIPVILASAKGSASAEENVEGAVYRIKKPFELDELFDFVNKYLKQ
jgi:CheY-like chemotaxis protein